MAVRGSPVPRPHRIEPSGHAVGDGREQQWLALVFTAAQLDGNCSRAGAAEAAADGGSIQGAHFGPGQHE
jgi:hypothetical protein